MLAPSSESVLQLWQLRWIIYKPHWKIAGNQLVALQFTCLKRSWQVGIDMNRTKLLGFKIHGSMAYSKPLFAGLSTVAGARETPCSPGRDVGTTGPGPTSAGNCYLCAGLGLTDVPWLKSMFNKPRDLLFDPLRFRLEPPCCSIQKVFVLFFPPSPP